ncbi:unnamed protein product [Bemisia tabaci]|uniref:Uncharacterized protein n=1 Tax=Bemisia tabaci TaxID=7038 RepID=A0A9P0AHX3_BEMTA|nr:unnamed protein product [Bemisia tabaci]
MRAHNARFYLHKSQFIQADDSRVTQCSLPLGMESGTIRDDDITASSSFDSNNVGPHHGRYVKYVNSSCINAVVEHALKTGNRKFCTRQF